MVRIMREDPTGHVLVGRLAETLGLTQPTVSHHMRALLEEGVVRREPEGRRAWYSIAPERSDLIDSLLGEARADGEPDFDRIARDLAERFSGVFSPETVAQCVADSRALLERSPGAPRLASRTAAFAASRLDALARSSRRAAGVPEVLFVCVQNAGRSQLAAGILRQLAGDRVTVRTAGSQPAAEVRQVIVAALDEIGVPLAGEFPKPLTDEAVRAADVVVTMGCGDACPIYAGRRYVDWDLEDPVGKPLSEVRAIRDEIEQRVRDLLSELVAE
jgi:arsenate reductase